MSDGLPIAPLAPPIAPLAPPVQAASAITLKAQTFAEQLLTGRHYVGTDRAYDPRFLLFEFTHNLVLREAQVALVREFVDAVRGGRPLVKQMLMGGGKTTVVGPMLALMLGDGRTLVVQTMPPALLEQSKATLRATFSSIVRKRVFTLSFERSSALRWSTVEKLQSAMRNNGVVLCTASTIKSLQLKLLEKMEMMVEPNGQLVDRSIEHDVRALARVIKLFKSGCLIMDEVDLLLHPLKAELNFPIGAKHPLDFSPERWTCAIHCLDAVFFVERQSMAVPFHQSGRAHRILEQLQSVIESGYAKRALQRSPHLVLLNVEWYHECMRPVMAQWMMLWLEANHVAGLAIEQIEAYVTGKGDVLADTEWEPWVLEAAAKREAARAAAGPHQGQSADHQRQSASSARAFERLLAYMEARLDPKAFKMLNLATEWLRTFLPHTLQKIDRVSFGLLSTHEYERLLKTEPHMPRSRFKLAIPFVGKDVPSRASEFAHPDIIIGLTVLAYRYEGLRKVDFEQDVIALLRADFEKEVGPFPLRKSSLLYESWVRQAGGLIKGRSAQRGVGTAAGAVASAGAGATDADTAPVVEMDDDPNLDERVVVPLWLLKQSNDEQMNKLYELLRKLPACLHWLLEQVVFPSFMQHQLLKLSASGQDLGGEMLFGQRIGFSGTPSDLLPLDLGRCGYEKGSDGKMLHVLTDPDVVSVEIARVGWTVSSLLRHVASAEPRLHALIDTGALITGLSNRAVARYLLANGLGRWCEGPQLSLIALMASDGVQVHP